MKKLLDVLLTWIYLHVYPRIRCNMVACNNTVEPGHEFCKACQDAMDGYAREYAEKVKGCWFCGSPDAPDAGVCPKCSADLKFMDQVNRDYVNLFDPMTGRPYA